MDEDWENLFYGKIIDQIEEGETFQPGDIDTEEPETIVKLGLDYLTEEIAELESREDGYVLTEPVDAKDVEYEPGIKDKEKLAEYALEEVDGDFNRYDIIGVLTSYLEETDAVKRPVFRTSKAATAADHLSDHERAKYGSQRKE